MGKDLHCSPHREGKSNFTCFDRKALERIAKNYNEQECKYKIGGTFKSKEKCEKNCGIRWNCKKREGKGWCEASANGKYKSWEDCSENCASKMDKKGWRCTREQECKYQTGGTFKSKGECEETCGLKYNCNDGVCVKDKKGKFTSMAECVNMCGVPKKN